MPSRGYLRGYSGIGPTSLHLLLLKKEGAMYNQFFFRCKACGGKQRVRATGIARVYISHNNAGNLREGTRENEITQILKRQRYTQKWLSLLSRLLPAVPGIEIRNLQRLPRRRNKEVGGGGLLYSPRPRLSTKEGAATHRSSILHSCLHSARLLYRCIARTNVSFDLLDR